MTTTPLAERAEAPSDSHRLDLVWRYRERQWLAMAVVVIVAGWQLWRGFDGFDIAGAGVREALAVAAPDVGPALIVLGIWLWLRADRQRLRIELLRDEAASIVRRPIVGDPISGK